MVGDDQEMLGRGSVGRIAATAFAAVLALGLSAGFSAAHAQMIPSGPEPQAQQPAKGGSAKGARKGGQPATAADGAATKDPAVALRTLESGIKSYEIGKLDPAVQQLTSALAGGLPSQQMARALYYRGLAFRKQAKPAQAISDLTSAIWLKGGLAEADRAKAIENRAAAYREAGLGDPAPIAAEPSRTAAAAAGDTPPASASAASSGGVGGFFSGLFGGASSGSAAQAPSTTASTRVASAPATATSSWGDATSVASAGGRQPTAAAVTSTAAAPAAAVTPKTKVAAAAPVAATPPAAPVVAAAPAAPAAPAYKGKFRLQVAAVRSRAEAEALAQKLKQAHGTAIGGREPAIEQSVIGAMGTFYRVRVGPYADANEPRQLCTRIKPDGFDCLVVTQ